jgi:hypothetical protein
MYERAVALDPQFAVAYAFLGRTYLMELIYQWKPDLQTQEQLFAFGQKAVALDDSRPPAHETLALAYLGRKQHRRLLPRQKGPSRSILTMLKAM